jgi:hypothetical protein
MKAWTVEHLCPVQVANGKRSRRMEELEAVMSFKQ